MPNKELNSVEQDSTINNSSLNKPGSRRKFFKKAALGAAITTIPSHSVWAGRLISGNMSGNVSGWADCNKLAIYSHGKFHTPQNSNGNGKILLSDIFSTTLNKVLSDAKWSDIFTSAPLDGANAYNDDLLQVFIDNESTHKMVNIQIVAMYINAVLSFNNQQEGVFWPVVGDLFSTPEAYAIDLYNQAVGNEGNVAYALGKIIDEHHVGNGLKATCN